MAERAPNEHQHPTREVLRFVERFASVLADAGIARMPARVFVALLTTDSGRLTAAELAELLQVSPAAISGAVRYLTQFNMITLGREPGARRDHYQLHDDTWYQVTARRDQIMNRWIDTTREGIAVLGPDTPAGRRLAETHAFFEFIHSEWADMLKRWEERRAALREQSPPAS